MTTTTLTLRTPDDWHCHLRDDMYLSRTVSDTAARFRRAIVMPNLTSPIINVEMAAQYYQRILAHIPQSQIFRPLMTLYLTEQTSETTLRAAKQSEYIVACKLYPAGATTHSAAGVKNIESIYSLLATMEEIDLPLLVHGEVVDSEVDIFIREQKFIDQYLALIIQKFPKLRIVLEHISTRYAVDFVKSAGNYVAATITPHHLLLNRNHIFVGGLRPHYYCLPILKTADDQQALIEAAISGDPHFFLGTDSAPHVKNRKENACGCAGIYSAHAAIELYAKVFADYQSLDKLENFASVFGAQFYKMPINTDTITLVNEAWQVPSELSFGEASLIPLFAGETIPWRLANLAH